MATPDTLLHLIAGLQQDMTVTDGRRRLLEYIRQSTSTRLALLFALDRSGEMLDLLEYSGRRPRRIPQSMPGRENPSFDAEHIPVEGLFGEALHAPGFVYIADASSDPRSLPAERYWMGHNRHVILSRLAQHSEARGVLVLCFAQEDRARRKKDGQPFELAIDEGNLLICTALLSAYLFPTAGGNASPLASIRPPGGTTSLSSGQPLSKRYEARLHAALEQERERIARDIHDGAAQRIAHVIHKLDVAQRMLEKQPHTALRELHQASVLLKMSLDELRHSIFSLVPVSLEKQGLKQALQALIEEYMRNQPGTKISLEMDDLSLLPSSLEAALYRFIQEALNNVWKHAYATLVAIRIRVLAGLLVVEVSDNGRGFDIERSGEGWHMGLRTMRERVRQLGGNWEIQSKPGRGTTVKARFPLPVSSTMLTVREREVLQLLVEGLTNRAIAEKLSVSTETVKSHVHHIMQKMQVHDRTQAAVTATRQHWL